MEHASRTKKHHKCALDFTTDIGLPVEIADDIIITYGQRTDLSSSLARPSSSPCYMPQFGELPGKMR